MSQKYIYLGDRLTTQEYKNKSCVAVKNQHDKCIRGKNSTMLVIFEKNVIVNVLARRLRKIDT